jgi:hypothetical protein
MGMTNNRLINIHLEKFQEKQCKNVSEVPWLEQRRILQAAVKTAKWIGFINTANFSPEMQVREVLVNVTLFSIPH